MTGPDLGVQLVWVLVCRRLLGWTGLVSFATRGNRLSYLMAIAHLLNKEHPAPHDEVLGRSSPPAVAVAALRNPQDVDSQYEHSYMNQHSQHPLRYIVYQRFYKVTDFTGGQSRFFSWTEPWSDSLWIFDCFPVSGFFLLGKPCFARHANYQ